jgi:hypothetical protein
MKYGIEEDATCHHNQFIGNNINYCKLGGINSAGDQSLERNNLSCLPEPHAGDMRTLDPENRLIQGFDLRLMDDYLEHQLIENDIP